MKNYNPYERYQRQVILPEFGEAGQQKLLQAKVLVIGAGGLGCPALQYLVAAGIGTIGIVDHDTVAMSNLHRQVLYTVRDIGMPKAELARLHLQRLNPDIHILSFPHRLTVQNALDIMQPFDIIVDGTDNFSSRYMINDACVLLDKPLIYAAISQFEGQVAILNAASDQPKVNYRDLFPQPPKEDEVLNCAEAGVLGVLPGILGTMQASETIKLITGMGDPLINRLLTYNALNNQFFELRLTAREETKLLIPPTPELFMQMDYEWLCSAPAAAFEIGVDEFDELVDAGNIDIIDVREITEKPEVHEFHHLRFPLKSITDCVASVKADTLVLFCQSGKRSKQAAQILSGIFGGSRKVLSLKGGIENWKKIHEPQRS